MENKAEIFGKYILLDKIATGGMAEVYLAKSPGAENVSKFVAIKRILPQYSNNHEFIEMFKEEAKIAINITHANVVSIFEFGIQNNLFFLAMQYVDGKNLRQILNRYKKEKKYFSLPQVIFLVKEAAKGLDHAHRCVDNTTGSPLNITHRDISPQNIMLSFEGEVKIIDFGIAKAESKIETTRAGTLKGKFGYMSPEQAEGFEVDFRTDIFSLGIVLWELLAQDRLFVSNNEINTLKKIRECHIPSLRKLDPNIPQELERITMKALARDRTLRYQSSEELAHDLQVFLNKSSPDFTSRDLSQALKTIFAEEREATRRQMMEYAKVQLPPEEKTEYIERTSTVTEKSMPRTPDKSFSPTPAQAVPQNQTPPPTTPPVPASQTSSKLSLDMGNKVDRYNIDFDRQDLVQSSNKKGQQALKYASQPTNERMERPRKSNTRISTDNNYTQTNYSNTQTESVMIAHSDRPLTKYLSFIFIVCGCAYYVNQNPDVQTMILNKTHEFIGATKSSSSEMDPKDIAKDLKDNAKSKLGLYYNLLVTSIPSGATIYINDKTTGVMTPGQVRVPVNETYTLRLEKDNYYNEQKSLLTSQQGEEIRVTLRKVQVAYLNISVSGGMASIYVNGKKIGEHSPVLKYPVAAFATLKVQAYNPQHGVYSEKVLEVKPGTVTQVNLNMSDARKPSNK